MICKQCGADFDDELKVCPVCGWQAAAPEEESAQPEQETEKPMQQTEEEPEEIPEEEPSAAEKAEAEPEEPATADEAAIEAAMQSASKSKLPLILGGVIGALVIVASILTVKLVQAKKPAAEPQAELQQTEVQSEQATSQQAAQPEGEEVSGEDEQASQEPAGNGVSYTVSAEELTDEVCDKVVATCGEEEMDNRLLNIYYWQEYYSFANAYGSYLAYFLDTTAGLDQQMYDEENTWQQMFLNAATGMFNRTSALVQEGKKNGFELPQEERDYLDESFQQLSAAAISYGFESVDDYLQTAFGPAATEEKFRVYLEEQYYASAYLQMLAEQEELTDEQIEAYYDENEADYASSGVEKIDRNVISVRHVLIVPEETDEEGNYTEEAWAAAEEKANALYQQWLAGDQSEDSFSTLAMENSADGSASSGGIYTDVYPGQMVTEFNDWCFDESRQPGDSGVVKTRFGYHIMFFVEQGDYIYWRDQAKKDYTAERSRQIEDEIADRYFFSVAPDNAALFDVLLNGQ